MNPHKARSAKSEKCGAGKCAAVVAAKCHAHAQLRPYTPTHTHRQKQTEEELTFKKLDTCCMQKMWADIDGLALARVLLGSDSDSGCISYAKCVCERKSERKNGKLRGVVRELAPPWAFSLSACKPLCLCTDFLE